jgi:signal transduction histidine kinase
VRINIQDTGIGIPKENLKKLFTPFFTTKEKGKGVGLGLSVVHGIIGKHKGKIDVESEIGVGTTFSIYLEVMNEKKG